MSRCPTCNAPLSGLARFCWHCEEYVENMTAAPVVPVEPAVLADTRSEKEIERSVINAWRALGFDVWKLSQPRETMQAEGVADLFVTGRGVCIWNEVKSATGKQSGAQVAFQQAVEANNGTYLLVRHEGEVIAWAERTVGV